MAAVAQGERQDKASQEAISVQDSDTGGRRRRELEQGCRRRPAATSGNVFADGALFGLSSAVLAACSSAPPVFDVRESPLPSYLLPSQPSLCPKQQQQSL